jgi:hypothetical protein
MIGSDRFGRRRMCRLGLAAAAIIAATSAQAQVEVADFEAERVRDMQKLCTASEETSDGKYALGFCYGWIEGLGQFYEQLLVDKRFNFKPAICPSKQLSREEARSIFVDWAGAHPAAADRPALFGMVNAMKEKFPCK